MREDWQYIPVFKKIPEDWVVVDGAVTVPKGYILICNNKSRFSGQRKIALLEVKHEKDRGI